MNFLKTLSDHYDKTRTYKVSCFYKQKLLLLMLVGWLGNQHIIIESQKLLPLAKTARCYQILLIHVDIH